VNALRQLMLEELRCRNFADTTVRTYLHSVPHFSQYFRRPPDQFGPEEIRKYQAALFTIKEDTSTAHEPASWRWPTSSAVLDSLSLNTVAGGSTGSTRRCCWLSRAAALPRWADIAIAAPAADMQLPSPTTRAETGTARAARATRADAGQAREREFLPTLYIHAVFTLPRNWPRSRCRTSGSSTTCSFTRALRPCL